MVRKACPREELHLARSTLKSSGSSHRPSPTSALGGLSDAARPLQPGREATSTPEGAAASAQHPATNRTPRTRSEPMALLPPGVGVAAAPLPDFCQRPRPGHPSESSPGVQELGGGGQASENPASCYFELLESLPLNAPALIALPFGDALPSPFGAQTEFGMTRSKGVARGPVLSSSASRSPRW